MKRNPRKVRWTKAYRKLAGKELAEDATFELERRRNRPIKYDREVMRKTVAAVQRIDEIRTRRQERFYEKRMAAARGQQVAADKAQLEAEVHLIKAPASLVTDKAVDKAKAAAKVAKAAAKLKVAAEPLAAAAAVGGADAMQE